MMIERQEVNGKMAYVAYVSYDFDPAPKESADLAKVIFDDGEMVLLDLKVKVEEK